MFDTPVVLCIFNRPDTTAQVMAAIRLAQPARLFVIADGPRPGHATDAEWCAQARAVIQTVDWPCEVILHYAETNIGCGRRIASGLTWLFEQVDEAIILEDDCVPDPTYFPYCRELLARYREDERVMMITGMNPFGAWRPEQHSYFFSLYSIHWGWATWRRAWQHYDFEMRQLGPDTFARICEVTGDAEQATFYLDMWEATRRGYFDTWDCQWSLMQLLRAGLSVVPAVNLVTNIGFGRQATHTHSTFALGGQLARRPMRFPLDSPPIVAPDAEHDAHYIAWRRGRPPVRLVVTHVEQHLESGRNIQALLIIEAALRATLPTTPLERSQLETLKSRALAVLQRRHETAR